MDRRYGSGRVHRAQRWLFVTLLSACVAISCADSDGPKSAGVGGCPAPCRNPLPQAGFDAGGSGGNAPDSAVDASVSGSSNAAGAMNDAAAGSAEVDCSDANPCTVDQREGSACTHSALADGSLCDDRNLCTTEDACRAGTCVGTARKSQLRVLGTAYAFGGARLRDGSEGSSGLVTFLSPDRLLFADALGSNTLLTLVTVDSGVLRVAAQTVTDRSLVWQPFNAWVWQSVPLAHLVPLPDARFAFVSLQGIQVFEATATGKLVERWRTRETTELSRDVAWSGGSLWTCPTSGTATRYAIASDSSLSPIDTPELAGENCFRLAVAPDGSLYASTTAGVERWAGEAGQPMVPQLLLPDVQAIELAVDQTHIALQRAARLGAFGETEVYRRADLGRVALFSQSRSDVPVGLALVSGKLLLEWQHVATDVTQITGALYDLPALGPTPIPDDEWLLRSRASGSDAWAANISRLSVMGDRVAFQPWRRVADVDPQAATAHFLTGPGHGEIAGVLAEPTGSAQTFSPYSLARLDASSYSAFSSGGMSLSADVQRLQLLLPEPGSARDSAVRGVQLANVETVTGLRRGPAGLEVAGALELPGGPAKLVQRGRKLYQVAAVGDTDYRIRVYDLDAIAFNRATPMPARELTLELPVDAQQGKREAFEVDVDPTGGQLAVCERRTHEEQVSNSLVWASIDGKPAILARGQVDTFSLPLLHAGRLLQVERSRVTLFAAKDGTLQPVWTQEAAGNETFFQALDVDDAARVYVTTGNGDTLHGLDWEDGSRASSVTIPEVVTASAMLDNHLLVAGAHSLSTLEPACGAPTSPPDAGSDASDSDAGTDAGDACGGVSECPDGGLVRSTLKGDATGDGCVDSSDTQLVTACLGHPVGDVCGLSYVADLDGNGAVNTKDYLLALQNQGLGCDAGK